MIGGTVRVVDGHLRAVAPLPGLRRMPAPGSLLARIIEERAAPAGSLLAALVEEVGCVPAGTDPRTPGQAVIESAINLYGQENAALQHRINLLEDENDHLRELLEMSRGLLHRMVAAQEAAQPADEVRL